jgi:hypothetical protein
MGHSGELARSADMATPKLENGKATYDLGKPFYTKVYLDENNEEQLSFLKDKIKEHFLTPKPVRWFGGGSKRTVVSVACGNYHLMVAAREHGKFKSVLYTSGLNN